MYKYWKHRYSDDDDDDDNSFEFVHVFTFSCQWNNIISHLKNTTRK